MTFFHVVKGSVYQALLEDISRLRIFFHALSAFTRIKTLDLGRYLSYGDEAYRASFSELWAFFLRAPKVFPYLQMLNLGFTVDSADYEEGESDGFTVISAYYEEVEKKNLNVKIQTILFDEMPISLYHSSY